MNPHKILVEYNIVTVERCKIISQQPRQSSMLIYMRLYQLTQEVQNNWKISNMALTLMKLNKDIDKKLGKKDFTLGRREKVHMLQLKTCPYLQIYKD